MGPVGYGCASSPHRCRRRTTCSAHPTRRRQLTEQTPALTHRSRPRLADTERLALTVIEDQPESLPHSPESARVLLYLAGAVVRYTYTTTPGALSHHDDEALHRAIETFREVLRNAL